MKNRTLLAASAAVTILVANSPAAEKPAKKPGAASKPAAAEKKEAPDTSAPSEKAPATAPAPAPAKEEGKTFAIKDPVATIDGQEIKVAEVEKVIEGMLAQRGGSIKDVPDAMKPV